MCPRCETALPWHQRQRTAALPGDLQPRAPGRCLRCLLLLTMRLMGFLLTPQRALSSVKDPHLLQLTPLLSNCHSSEAAVRLQLLSEPWGSCGR